MDRINRISEEVKRELGEIVRNEIKDPRLPVLTSITAVKVTKDLKFATVYVSVFGDEKDRLNAIEALKSASGFIRREISHRVNLRNTPEFKFEIDRSIERGIYMSSLIDKTLEEDRNKKKE